MGWRTAECSTPMMAKHDVLPSERSTSESHVTSGPGLPRDEGRKGGPRDYLTYGRTRARGGPRDQPPHPYVRWSRGQSHVQEVSRVTSDSARGEPVVHVRTKGSGWSRGSGGHPEWSTSTSRLAVRP
eukprot:6942258-Prymnesium_polylepis.1